MSTSGSPAKSRSRRAGTALPHILRPETPPIDSSDSGSLKKTNTSPKIRVPPPQPPGNLASPPTNRPRSSSTSPLPATSSAETHEQTHGRERNWGSARPQWGVPGVRDGQGRRGPARGGETGTGGEDVRKRDDRRDVYMPASRGSAQLLETPISSRIWRSKGADGSTKEEIPHNRVQPLEGIQLSGSSSAAIKQPSFNTQPSLPPSDSGVQPSQVSPQSASDEAKFEKEDPRAGDTPPPGTFIGNNSPHQLIQEAVSARGYGFDTEETSSLLSRSDSRENISYQPSAYLDHVSTSSSEGISMDCGMMPSNFKYPPGQKPSKRQVSSSQGPEQPKVGSGDNQAQVGWVVPFSRDSRSSNGYQRNPGESPNGVYNVTHNFGTQ
ncbi:hypothetical protein BD779DRAFT_650336 [Infundibulicybe gibba]|nr:hypothetical protein BD779DRAFT_650336 [Infundibulicybe gibba]